MTDQQTIAAYDKFIDDYARLTKPEAPHPTLIAFVERLKPGGYILDLGCGQANAAAHMRKNGLRVDPTDASIEMVKLANKTHDIGARQAVFDDVSGKEIYDGVWANFSLLHASREDFPRYLNALHQTLKPDGLFHIAMKLGDGAKRDRLERNYSYYSQAELAEYLAKAGFKVIETTFGEDLGLAGDVESWIAILSRN